MIRCTRYDICSPYFNQMDLLVLLLGYFLFQKMLFEKFFMFIKINCNQKYLSNIALSALLLVQFCALDSSPGPSLQESIFLLILYPAVGFVTNLLKARHDKLIVCRINHCNLLQWSTANGKKMKVEKM